MLTILLAMLVVTLVVVIHYEVLHVLTGLIPKMRIKHRLRIVVGVFGALLGHIVEIVIFGAAYYFMLGTDQHGQLQGNFDGSFADCIYFSFTTFTTLGFGDIEPMGNMRFITGIESLTGLLLITWTASFMYYEMQHYWREVEPNHNKKV